MGYGLTLSAVAVALFTVACSATGADSAPEFNSNVLQSSNTLEVIHNEVVDAELLGPVESAAARWSAAGCLDIRVDGGGVTWSLAEEPRDSTGKVVAGLVGPSEVEPTYALVRTDKQDKERVALHEMGHRLGAAHVDDTHGIMAERSYIGWAFIDEASLSAVCAVRDCGCFVPEAKP